MVTQKLDSPQVEEGNSQAGACKDAWNFLAEKITRALDAKSVGIAPVQKAGHARHQKDIKCKSVLSEL